MTITSQSNRISYDGNGSTQDFSYPYYYLAKSDIVVLVVDALGVETVKALTTHYTLTDPDPAGGTVHMLVAPATGEQLVIYRDVPITQEFNPEEGGALPADSLEGSLDKLTMITQQLRDLISRSLVLSPATQLSDLRLPDPAAGELLGWNGAADALVNVLPGDVSLFTLSALGRTLCSQSTPDAMADVIMPFSAAEAGMSPAVNPAGSGIIFINPHRRNIIQNGNMWVWQRGTSWTGFSMKSVISDRWQVGGTNDGTINAARSTNAPTIAQAGLKFPYSANVTVNAVDTSISAVQYCIFSQAIEGADIVPIMGQTISISFWFATDTPGVYCLSLISGGNNLSYVKEFTAAGSGTWEKFTFQIPMSDGSSGSWYYGKTTGMRLTIALAAGSNFQTTPNAWQAGLYYATSNQVNFLGTTARNCWLTGVQLEVGPYPSPFEMLPFAEFVRNCQRYWEKSYNLDVNPGTVTDVGSVVVALPIVDTYSFVPFKVSKRDTPTSFTYYSTFTGASSKARDLTAGADINLMDSANYGENGLNVRFDTAAADHVLAFHWVADADLG